ncbi:2-dehydro-3-deoxy-phosphogluconate aldolase, partial [Bienertia sinuspersici]
MAAGSIGLCFCPPMLRRSPTSQLKASPSSASTACNHHSSPTSSLSPPLCKTLSDIHTSGIIACLRAPSAEIALGAARAALRGGIKVLEVVMSTPGVFEVLHQLLLEYPTTTLGVGTVLDVEDAKAAVKVGAKFLMSPAMIKEILSDIQDPEVLYIPGVMTPTEILSAYNAGARIVKIYPVSVLGGIDYISTLKKPFHHIPMVASQGIKMGLVAEFITRGATAVVLSDAIFHKEAISQGDFGTITERAQLAASTGIEAMKQFRQ